MQHAPLNTQNPPLNVPGTIVLDSFTGNSASGTGGGLPHIKGNVVVLIEGDTGGVFSAMGLETMALVHDPDLPPGSGRAWETVLLAGGAGPIPIGTAEALLITVAFAAPAKAGSFTAMAVVVQEGTTGPALFQVPIQATSAVQPGGIQILAQPCQLLANGIFAGKTENLPVLLKSTLPRAVTGVFLLEPSSGDANFASPAIPVEVAAGATVPATLPVTCAVTANPGFNPESDFRFVTPDPQGGAGFSARLTVLANRTVTLTTDLSQSPLLAAGTSTPCKVTIFDSGGLSEIVFQPGPLPAGVTLQMGPVRTVSTSGPLPDDSRVDEMDMVIVLGAQVQPGNLPAFSLNWTVPAADFHLEIDGTVTFNISVAVSAPAGSGLSSTTNYFLEENGNSLLGVSVTVKFGVDLISSANAWSIQLNSYSALGDATGWQQYVVYVNPQSTQLYARIDNWDASGKLVELIRTDTKLANLPGTTVPAGYAITISLNNDTSGNITGANYSVTDNRGQLLGKVTTSIIGQLLRTNGQHATLANLGAIRAFQVNIVADYNFAVAALTSGSGTITYSASNNLSVTNAAPIFIDDPNVTTGESANLTYGLLPLVVNAGVPQTFQATLGVTANERVLDRKLGRHPHGLPAPAFFVTKGKAKATA